MEREIVSAVQEQVILNKIYNIRNQKTMLDFDLAELYQLLIYIGFKKALA